MKSIPDKVVVVGADYHGEWAKDVSITFKERGIESELIYTNTLFGRRDSSMDVSSRAFMERIKEFFRVHARFFFDFIKETRRRKSEFSLMQKIREIEAPDKKIWVLFIWTPPGVFLLKSLKKRNDITLILWQGEEPGRNIRWGPSFPYFDHIFSVDEEWIPLFREDVQKKMTFLPLSSSASKFFPLKQEERESRFSSDIAFVGFYRPERAEVLAVLKEHDIKIYGYWWESGMGEFPWIKDKYGGPLSNEDANQAFNGGKIQIGRLPTPIAYANTVTQRVFDVALAKNFQLSAYSLAIEKMFGDSVPMFRDKEELRTLVDHYLTHPHERQRLAEISYDIALKEHTYKSRVEAIINTMASK
jgi:hypothetical protein